jgi:NTE family protein
MEQDDVIDLTVPDNGFIKGKSLKDDKLHFEKHPIEKLRIPFWQLRPISSGKEVVFGSGNTGAAVRASCSIPRYSDR